MSDQYSQKSGTQYDLESTEVVSPTPTGVTTLVSTPVFQEVLIAGKKMVLPRWEALQQMQNQLNLLNKELIALKSKHAKLQQQHLNLASQVLLIQNKRTSSGYD